VETTVAVEDRRFYKHHGFDLRGTLRAVVRNLLEGKALEGGSTITQQYVRSRYLENARTIPRKLREIMLAIQLEQKYTKDKILEAYLNGAYFGEGNYGVEAASESYFGIHASELNAEQSALLVSLLRSPNSGSPFVKPEEVVRRRNLVLDQMAEANIIPAPERDQFVQLPLQVRDPDKTEEVKMAPHFVEFVKRRLLQDRRLGETYKERYRAVFSGGLSITTSLDTRVHEAAERAVTKLPRGVPEAAVVVMDPETGELLAYRGGKDFDARKFDLVSQGRRQPGSAFKTFALVTALSSNFSPNLPLGGSSPCEFELTTSTPWKVENFGGHSYGTVSLKEATTKSINCAYADLVMNHIEPREVMSTAKSMGIDSPLDPYPSIALGGLTNGVTPLEMTRAFATLASEGWKPEVRPILEVRDRDGEVIISDSVETELVLPENVARMATSVLREVVDGGTATDAKAVERPAAGKTGTTQANRDAWFIGYTIDFVGTVWLGHPDAQIE
ncbi:MAG: transglycosylase domain-containing protein, partial [Acidimicrobiia bacterium]